jgi:sterol desaturase/sphingolipid hydroxylase (fatty acid hydroxylase superfamily)
MRRLKASAQTQSERMFQHPLLERMSRIPPWQPPAIFLPIILWTGYRGWSLLGQPVTWLTLFAGGLMIWTFMEYVLHRFVFHLAPQNALGKRLIWILHGVHHDWPNDKLRLVFPPSLSLPLAYGFWLLFSRVFGSVDAYAAFSGLATGYLAYDMIHYAVHHFAPASAVGRYLRRYHLSHHFKQSDRGFGVSSPLWDVVFGTLIRSARRDGTRSLETADAPS